MTMSLETLLEVYIELTGINASFKFYDKVEKKRDIIDNPLKVLDFIKDIYKPVSADRIIDPKQEKINDKFTKLQAAMELFNNMLKNRSAEYNKKNKS